MAVLKCKMCGGDLEICEGVSVCECEYCGTKQTVPSADNEKKITLFGRANRLRFNNEFDKAAGVYESIVAEFPEESEAYWGLVLCKYGIEYVDDPATSKKIPTCHRSSFESVMDDSNYEQTLENADTLARGVYREEAKQIEELRKGIIEVSSKEEPYDIFICYKETAENGERTIDSVIAQDVYDALTEKGYRVFFSRISLEDKLGVEYESYIFAALNSAKIMLAFGTDYEYYNAVWVKNEWSRFLQLIAKGEKKTLIPCYKGIDAYDMPKEFAKLQAQDMGKVGAIQDLLRGVEKILSKNGDSAVAIVQSTSPVAPGVQSLLERAFMFLEDGKWDEANAYCDKVLDIDPKCAKAYLGKLLAEFKCNNLEQLQGMNLPFENSDNFKKTTLFSDDIGNTLRAAVDFQKNRLSNLKNEINDGIKNAIKFRGIVATSDQNTIAICIDGTPLVTGEFYNSSQSEIINWDDLIAVATSKYCTVGLKSNGMIVNVSDKDYDFSSWLDIKAISAGDFHVIGLCSDGTVVATGDERHNRCDVGSWNNIIAVAAGAFCSVGLKNDGTVVCTDQSINVSDWKDIVDISASEEHVVGLRRDGTVVAAGNNSEGECDVDNWRGVVAIAAGQYYIRQGILMHRKCYTVGVCTDGTVITTGVVAEDKSDLSKWRNIVAIFAGGGHIIGLKNDGSFITAGDNDYGECNIQKWRIFNDINKTRLELQEEQKRQTLRLLEEARKKEAEARRLAEGERQKRLSEERKILQEEQRIAEEKRQKEFQLQSERKQKGLCPYCGGEFKGLFTKKCSACGKPKNY